MIRSFLSFRRTAGIEDVAASMMSVADGTKLTVLVQADNGQIDGESFVIKLGGAEVEVAGGKRVNVGNDKHFSSSQGFSDASLRAH